VAALSVLNRASMAEPQLTNFFAKSSLRNCRDDDFAEVRRDKLTLAWGLTYSVGAHEHITHRLYTAKQESRTHGELRMKLYRLQPSDIPGDDGRGKSPFGAAPMEREDLAYQIELWDETGNIIEQVVAMTASASIGYAAYYAATREYPQRCITLKHKNSTLSRWNGTSH
jgi:hypothetical protein